MSENLSSKQYKAISKIVLEGKSKKEAMQELGLCSETFSRWMRNPNFVKVLEERKKEFVDVMYNKLFNDSIGKYASDGSLRDEIINEFSELLIRAHPTIEI